MSAVESLDSSCIDLSEMTTKAGHIESILIQRLVNDEFKVIKDTLGMLKDLRRNTGLDEGQYKTLTCWLEKYREEPKVLDLYSGSCAVSRACEHMGYKALSIDVSLLKGNSPPVLLVDALKWPFEDLRRDSFVFQWMSPPCYVWSSLQQLNLGRVLQHLYGNDPVTADMLVTA